MADDSQISEEAVLAIAINTTSLSRNVDQDVLVTTRDKVELALRREMPRYIPTGQLLASAGLFIALLTSILTAEFAAFLGLDGAVWRGIFTLGSLISFALMVNDIVRWFRRPSMEKLVDAIASDAANARPRDAQH